MIEKPSNEGKGPDLEARLLVVASVALPPPVNGQSLMNASIVEDLRKATRLKIINTSPNKHRKSFFYHLRRLAAAFTVPWVLAWNSSCPERVFYTVVEPGLGIFYNFLSVATARIFRYSIFLHHHASSYTKIHDARFNALTRFAGKDAHHIALSQQMSSDLKSRYDYCREVIVVHNASRISAPVVVPPIRVREGLTIGFLSNLSIDKGLDTVLRSFESVHEGNPSARLILAGPTTNSAAADLLQSAKQKFGNDLQVLGAVSGATKESFFTSIDVFLFPSRYRFEAQPLVILEALSYGVPVIATRHGYTAELVEGLGTAADLPDFVTFFTEFAGSMASDFAFSERQRRAARARFDDLNALSLQQNMSLFRLLLPSALR